MLLDLVSSRRAWIEAFSLSQIVPEFLGMD
jgi:hypothetical protein